MMREIRKKLEIEEIYYLENLEQFEAITSGIRYRMIRLISAEPKTAAQLGRELGISRPKAHYHLQVLVRLGLAILVDEILVSGIVEKYFIGKARFYSIDHLNDYGLQHPEEKGFNSRLSQVKTRFLTTVLGVTREKVFETEETRDSSTDFTFDFGARLTAAQVREVEDELTKIAQRIRLMNEENLKHDDFSSMSYYRSTILFMESENTSILPEDELEDLPGQVVDI